MAFVVAPTLANAPDQPQSAAVPITSYGPATSPPILSNPFLAAPNMAAGAPPTDSAAVGYATT